MDEAIQRDLAALADGSLEPEARAALLRRVEDSPELADALAEQRAAVTAIRATRAEPAPDELRAKVAAMVAEDRRAGRPRRRVSFARPRVFAFGSAVAALAAAAVIVFGGASGPSVAEAAQLALSPARSPAPAERAGGRTLDASVDGVAYPYWEEAAGWKATGARSDALGGRNVHTVFYVNKAGTRIGYSIAAGSPLSATGGQTVERRGVRYRVLRSDGATIVTWLRGGHTCILAGRGVDRDALLNLASWS
jgi:hypothetical protein